MEERVVSLSITRPATDFNPSVSAASSLTLAAGTTGQVAISLDMSNISYAYEARLVRKNSHVASGTTASMHMVRVTSTSQARVLADAQASAAAGAATNWSYSWETGATTDTGLIFYFVPSANTSLPVSAEFEVEIRPRVSGGINAGPTRIYPFTVTRPAL